MSRLWFRPFKPRRRAPLVALTLLILGMLALGAWQEYRHATEKAKLEAEQLTRLLAYEVHHLFREVDELQQALTRLVPPPGEEPNRGVSVDDWLRTFANSTASVDALNVYTADGELRYSSIEGTDAVNVADRDHFQALREDRGRQTSFSDLLTSRTTGKPSLFQLRALRDEQGRFLGAITAVIGLEQLGSLLREVNVDPRGVALLRRSDSSALIARHPRYNEADFNRPLPPDNPIRQRLMAGEGSGELSYTASTDGVKRIGSFQVLDESPFYVQVSVSQAHALADWWRRVGLLGGVAALLVLGSLLALRRFQRTRQAERVAEARAEALEAETRTHRSAIDAIAYTIAAEDDAQAILAATCRNLGEALKADRALFYDIDFEQQRIIGQEEWLNPARSDITPSIGTYPLAVFGDGVKHVHEHRTWLLSHADAIHPALSEDGAAAILHEQMSIGTLLWYPFAFRKGGHHLLVLNWLERQAEPDEQQLGFLATVAGLVEVAQNKIRMLERSRHELETAKRDLERNNAELRRLAEISAHHLMEPMRRLTAYSQRLHRELPEAVTEGTDWQRMEQQNQRMSALLMDLQRYLAHQTTVPVRETVRLEQVVNSAQSLLAARGDDAEAVRVVFEPDPPPPVYADFGELVELFRQLLANARVYARLDEPPEVHIHIEEGVEGVQIIFSDNGRGFEPEYGERIFRLFERLYPDQDGGGTGLGLALARRIVENHGGWMTAESAGRGQGATIRFLLPGRVRLSTEPVENPVERMRDGVLTI